jgi:hypothetical protein
VCLQYHEARKAVPSSIRVVEMTIDDSWLRDSGPTVSAGARHQPPAAHSTLPSADSSSAAAGTLSQLRTQLYL